MSRRRFCRCVWCHRSTYWLALLVVCARCGRLRLPCRTLLCHHCEPSSQRRRLRSSVRRATAHAATNLLPLGRGHAERRDRQSHQ